MMTGAPEAILNHEVTSKMEVRTREKQSKKLGAGFPDETMKLFHDTI